MEGTTEKLFTTYKATEVNLHKKCCFNDQKCIFENFETVRTVNILDKYIIFVFMIYGLFTFSELPSITE